MKPVKFLKMALGLALVAGCSSAKPESPIRDLRPTKLERGEQILVEGNGSPFVVGAPTTLQFDSILDVKHQPLNLVGRAVAVDRVVVDIDERAEQLVGGQHIVLATTVSVRQEVAGKVNVSQSDTHDTFAIDLFPHNLLHLANHFAASASGHEIFPWLGMEVKAAPGGVLITAVTEKMEPNAVLSHYDRAPFDGEITKEEAKQGGMSDADAKRWDKNHDGKIEMYELEASTADDGLAAQAGLKAGDLIVSADGKAVASPSELDAVWVSATEQVDIAYARAGSTGKTVLPTAGKPDRFPEWLILAIALALAAGLVALPVPVIAGLVVVWERKVSAYMQSRLGPNRVGPNGWLQWLADGLKLLMKEDITPTEADPYLFKMSPYLAFIGVFLTFLVLPFSHYLMVADLNIGLLFLLSVTSLVVVSIIMGGWSSNSKWSLLGGMRSAAQIISYELPASVALLTVVTITGSLSTQKIVEAQGGAPWQWYVFRSPFTFAAFFIWFISALAEGNRTPFDLPEAESELVSGYNTEYSGFRFSLFPMVEWVNLFVIGAVATTIFLGGWQIPFVSVAMIEKHPWLDLVGFGLFLIKDIAIIFVIIWIRWTLPRFRVDQMMNLCWKYFIPTSFVCFLGGLAWSWLIPADSVLTVIFELLMFGVFGVGFGVWFGGRVLFNSRGYQDLVLNDALGRTNA